MHLIETIVVRHLEVKSFSRFSDLANLRLVVDEVAELG